MDAFGDEPRRPELVAAFVSAADLAPLRHAVRILFAAEPPFDDVAADPDGPRRISSPADLHPVLARNAVRDALVRVAATGDRSPPIVVHEHVELARPGTGGSLLVDPVSRGIRCWVPLAPVDRAAAPTPPGRALELGDVVTAPAGVGVVVPANPAGTPRPALVIVLGPPPGG